MDARSQRSWSIGYHGSKPTMRVPRVALLVAIGAALLAGGLAMVWRPCAAMRIYALVPEASGVQVGTEVTYRGIPTGRVADITFADSGVRLALDLERADVPLRAGDSLWLRTRGLLGDKVIDIKAGPREAPRLREGGELRAMVPLFRFDQQSPAGPMAADSAGRDSIREAGSRP